jgi:hypothetical protein
MGWRRFKPVCERGIQLVSILLLVTGATRAAGKDGPTTEALVRSPVSIVLDGRHFLREISYRMDASSGPSWNCGPRVRSSQNWRYCAGISQHCENE